MDRVTVLGLGKMGTAIVEVLLKAGRPVTIWNRTPTRSAPLVEKGAQAASSPAAAVQAAAAVLVSVSGYPAANDVLRQAEVSASLPGKTLIQLSSGTPQEAREAATWAEQVGAKYLDGALLGYPAHIGSERATVLLSGSAEAFAQQQALLGSLGTVRYLGANAGAASALDCAALTVSMLNIVGLIHGIALCESESVDPEELVGMLNARLMGRGELNRMIAEAIRKRAFANPAASLSTWAAVGKHLAQISIENQLSPAIPTMLQTLFDAAEGRGLGSLDISSLVEVMGAPRS